MPRKRQPLRLLPHEDELLRTLYREFDIPTDQYPQRPDDLTRLVSTWTRCPLQLANRAIATFAQLSLAGLPLRPQRAKIIRPCP